MDLKHIKNISETSAEILIFDNIGAGSNTGQQIAEEVSWLVDNMSITEILVRINSGGGSMIEGFGIFSALQAAKAKGVTINVKIEGLAASMAGIIAMVGDSISMLDYGILMMHNPHTGGGKVDDKTQQILDKFKQSAIKIITNRTGKSSEEIDALMTEETWLDASEALEQGFIDNIIETGSKKQTKEMHNALFEIAMSLHKKEKKPNKITMKKVIAHFELGETASEQDILDKVTELENRATDSETKMIDLDAKNFDLENKLQEMETEKSDLSEKMIESNKKIVNILIDNAIKAGKIKKDAKDSLIEASKGDADLVETMINAVETPKIKLSDLIDNKSEETKMSFRDLEKNNPAKLAEIKSSNPEEYKRLYDLEYKK